MIDMLDILPFQKPKIHSLYNISFKTCSEEVFEWEQPVVFSGENALSDGSGLAALLTIFYFPPNHKIDMYCFNFRPKEVTCDSCLSITRLVAGFLGQEDKRVEAVEFLASDFCINGVPEDDMEFCDVSVTPVTYYMLFVCR